MDAKEILEKVKLFFNDLVTPAAAASTAPPATPEYELKIGGKVTIDKMEPGGMVMIDGAPALPGDIELVDGTMITVGDSGVISSITMTDITAVPEMDMGAKFTAFETATNEKFTSYETKFSAYEQRFADYEVKLNKATKVIDELLKLSTLLVEAPAAAPDAGASAAKFSTEVKKEKDLSILFN